MNIKALLRAAMICAALAAGAAEAQMSATQKIIENVAKLQVGKSNSKDVEALLGKPDKVTRNNRKSQDEWGYSIYADSLRGTVWVMMSDDGVVREVFQVMERKPGTS